MDIHDNLHRTNGVILMVGIKSFLTGYYDVWLANLGMVNGKSRIGRFGDVHKFRDFTYFPYIAHTWISKIREQGKKLNWNLCIYL